MSRADSEVADSYPRLGETARPDNSQQTCIRGRQETQPVPQIHGCKLIYLNGNPRHSWLTHRSQGHAMDKSVDQWWKIGEGFMNLENMYLVRLVSVSTGSFQPEVWILIP